MKVESEINKTINESRTDGTGTVLVGRYRIVRKLGEGGMGSVWLAEDLKLDNDLVAIKMLPSILVHNKKAYAQVKQEAKVSLKLSHANIVKVRTFEEDDDNPFLVLDYIEGESLEDYLAEKGALSESETVRLMTPVAAALDAAHEQGVVHRDVKPGNVMIAKNGKPYILDFGIAREVKETMTKVTGRDSSGTILYMSPEQQRGDDPNPAQDVYSFAAMVYECLTGNPPFYRGDVADQIKNKQPTPLPDKIGVGAAVLSGLGKTPDVRPANCAGVIGVVPAGKKLEMPESAQHNLLARIDHFELLHDLGGGTYNARDVASGRTVVVSANAGPNAKPHNVLVADYKDSTVKRRLAVFPGGVLYVNDLMPEKVASKGGGKAIAVVASAVALVALVCGFFYVFKARYPVKGMEVDSSAGSLREGVAISVNGLELTRVQLDADVDRIVKAKGAEIPAEQMSKAKQEIANQIVRSFLVEKVLVDRAKAEGMLVTDADRRARADEFLKTIANTPDAPKTLEDYFKKFPLGEDRARAEFENGILIDKMIKAKLPKKDYTSEAKRVIDGIVAQNEIAKKSEAGAKKKIKALKDVLDATPVDTLSEKFAELAKANSDCPSSAKGGDLGVFARGQMVKEFDEVAFNLPVNKVSYPFMTQFGYHLVLVTKRFSATGENGGLSSGAETIRASHILIKADKPQPVPELNDAIKQLEKKAERSFVEDFVRNLIKQAKIVVAEEFKRLIPSDDKADESQSP